MKYLNILLCITFFYTCASNPPKNTELNNNYTYFINKYSNDYFIGVGIGKGSTQETAVQIAKVRALGELSDNIKVTIHSKLEVTTVSTTHNGISQLDETVKEEIISIGNATVRLPEYEILSVSQKDNGFHAEVLAKKLMSRHIEESAKDLELEDAGEILMSIILEKNQ